jgi:hypothetical protein
MTKEMLIQILDEEILKYRKILCGDGFFTGEVYGTLMGKIQEAERIKELIQSEPEEKTNFNVITESPEKLYKFILDQYGYSQVKDGAIYINLEWWLNEKAGE